MGCRVWVFWRKITMLRGGSTVFTLATITNPSQALWVAVIREFRFNEPVPECMPTSVGQYVLHYSDVIMKLMASQITSLTIVCSTVYSGADQRKHQNSASLAFVGGIHQWLVNSPHKGPVTWKMFPFDDVIMLPSCPVCCDLLGGAA